MCCLQMNDGMIVWSDIYCIAKVAVFWTEDLDPNIVDWNLDQLRPKIDSTLLMVPVGC